MMPNDHKPLTLIAAFMVVGVLVVAGVSWGMHYWQVRQFPAPVVTSNDQIVDTSDLSSKALATEDWVTYRNEEVGIELKLPTDWEIREKNNNFLHFIKPNSSIQHPALGKTQPSSLVIDLIKNVTLETALNTIEVEENKHSMFPISLHEYFSSLHIDGNSAIKTRILSNEMGLDTWQYVLIADSPNVIRLEGFEEVDNFLTTLFPTILSTIKVLK